MNIKFFNSQARFRAWLERNHDKVNELWVGFHKKHSRKKSITYQEALDEALCFGWIDGLKKRVDDTSYTMRFTPRKPKSIWSRVNTKRAEELKAEGRMTPAGLKAFASRDPKRSGLYSFENAPQTLDVLLEKRFQAHKKAWSYFQAQPPGYKKTFIFWIMSAKKEETRLRRLDQLISVSAKGLRLDPLTGKPAAE